MDTISTVKENFENVNENFYQDIGMKELREQLLRKFGDYQKTMKYMTADAPIQILCLPKAIEGVLLSSGCLRVYDLLDLDLAKIEGLGVSRIRDLTARLDQFFSML